MKRSLTALAILLCVLMVFSLSACGGKGAAAGWTPGGPGTVFLATADDPADGGTLIVANSRFTSYGAVADFPLVGETDHGQNLNLTVIVGEYGALTMRGPMRVKEVEMVSKSKLNLNGKEFSILSTKHRDRSQPKDALGHWKGDWPGTVDYSVEGSTIRWGGGFLMFIR